MNMHVEPDTVLAVLAAPTAVIYAGWLLSGRFSMASMRNLFLLVAGYFALCVPLDLLAGLELRGAREYLADLNRDLFRADIARGLVLYLTCIVGFLATYHLAPGKPLAKLERRHLAIPELSVWLALAVNVACLVFYLSVFGGFARIERLYLARQTPVYKLLSLFITLTYAFNFLFILRTDSRRAALAIVAWAILFSFLSGGRMWAASLIVFYLVRFRVSLRRWQVIALGVTFVAASLMWKEVTAYFWETGHLPSLWNPDQPIGLSRFEGIQSWVMTVEILSDGPCPYWKGWSYFVLPMQLLWPRFLLEFPPQTLSEQYAAFLRPTLFDAGGGIGFSAIGEAWLNFGFLGPAALGALWGAAAKWIDTRPKGIAMIVFVLMTLRLFRSDFGSLFKSWTVMFAAALVIVLITWQLFGAMTLARHPRRNRQRSPSW